MSIVVMVDSSACLPKSILKRKDLCLVSLGVSFDDENYEQLKEGKNFEISISNSKRIPTIHKPSIKEVERVIRKYIDSGYDVIYIAISSKLSSHYNDLENLSKKINSVNFSLIDSVNIGSGEALLVMKAFEYIDKGYGIKKLTNYLNKVKYEVKSTYMTSDFDFLYAQNTCQDLRNDYLKHLGIYPIFNIYKGDIKYTFNSNDLSVAYQILENSIVDNSDINKESEILITYPDKDDIAYKLKKKILKQIKNASVTLIKNNSFLSMCLGKKGISCSIITDLIDIL